MTFSVLGIDTTQVKEIDPRTGKEKVFYLPKINQETGKEERVLLPKSSRLQGTYIIGSTGSGKTGLFKNLIRQDIKQQICVWVLDPHGDLINDIIAGLSDDEVERVILLDIEDTKFQGTDYYPGLNIYQCDDPTDDDLVTETHGRIEHIFDVVTLENSEEKLGFRVAQGIRNSAYTFIDSSPVYGCTMLELPMLFREDVVRTKLASHLLDTDATVKDYWKKYEGFDRFEKASREDMVVNKIEGYIINRKLRRIIGQSKTTLNFREVMDCKPGKIVLVKLPGDNEGMTELLGKMLVAQLLAAAFSRKNIPLDQRKQCNIYCDEFELYASDDFTRLLKECRKYGMAVSIAHQSRDFIDLRNKAASLQVANLIVLRITRKDADEIAGNFDCTPIRTKKVLKQRTKPVFKEWDEYVWDSEEAEKHAKELQERVAEAERNAEEAPRKRNQAVVHAVCAQALAQHFRNAFRPKKAFPENGWCNGYSLRDLKKMLVEERNAKNKEHILSYLHDPFTPWWITPDGETGGYNLMFYKRDLDYRSADIATGLMLVKAESETVHDSLYIWPEWWLWRTKDKDKRLFSYTYLKRVEWYSFTEKAAISGLEYALRHTVWPENIAVDKVRAAHYPGYSLQREWNGKGYSLAKTDPLFGKLLEEFIKEVHTSLLSIYEGVRCGTLGCNCRIGGVRLKFIPRLAPYIEPHNMGTYPSDRQGEWSPITWPDLAKETPPEVGQQWAMSSWIEHGQWETFRKPEFENWAVSMETRLEAQVEECWKAVEETEQEEKLSKQCLAQLTKEWQTFQNQYRKVIHHTDYLGEQPEVEERTRISHSYSEGSSETIGFSRMGPSHGRGTSSSKSTSYSTADVQWYDLVDELDQTPQQRRDEIAGEIASLPDYIARVKIKNESDELVEYIIRTLKPEPGLRGRALEERLLKIKETMVRDKIIRPKLKIDEEIRKRQQLLRLPQLKPSETQVYLPPSEDEPPIKRRG